MIELDCGEAGLQHDLLKTGGTAIQSCPYIWHAAVAEHLREILPEGIRDSASAAEPFTCLWRAEDLIGL